MILSMNDSSGVNVNTCCWSLNSKTSSSSFIVCNLSLKYDFLSDILLQVGDALYESGFHGIQDDDVPAKLNSSNRSTVS